MHTPRLIVSEAVAADAPLILAFIKALADYEQAAAQVTATEAQLVASLFSPTAAAKALLCREDGEAVGFAVYFFSYSTWQGRCGLYLEDLYVVPEKRNCGAGKALFQRLAQIAVENDCGRMEWNVLDWNRPAIEFYTAAGAVAKNEWVRYRLSGDALRCCAAAIV